MSAGVRILVVVGAVLLFLGLRLTALLRIDHALLGWIAGGSHAGPELVPIPVKVPRRR
jgi:hypothetical protein